MGTDNHLAPTLSHPSPWLQVLNPATAEAIATVPQCGAAETQAAIRAAAAQFDAWAGRTGKERASLLRRCVAQSSRSPQPPPRHRLLLLLFSAT